MARWLRILRGIVGMGVTFAVVLSGIFSFTHLGRRMLFGGPLELRHLLIETIAAGTAPVGFLIGAVFAGALALTGRGQRLQELTTWHFGLLGAATGLLFSLFVPTTSPDLLQSVVDAVFFALVGGGAASGTLLIARTAKPQLAPAQDRGELSDGLG